jgi:thiol-disulfide isomerase/thioredoxin
MTRILLLLTIIFSCHLAMAQDAVPYSAKDIMKRATSSDTVYIINFWATWCMPCVGELPEFNELQQRYSGKPVKVLLVSLDFKEDHTFKLTRFLQMKHIASEVVWLSDTNPDKFVPVIDKDWEGSIPATLILSKPGNFRRFIEGTITKEQVATIVDKLL